MTRPGSMGGDVRKTPTPKTLSAGEKARRTVKATVIDPAEIRVVIRRATSRVRTKTQIGNAFRG